MKTAVRYRHYRLPEFAQIRQSGKPEHDLLWSVDFLNEMDDGISPYGGKTECHIQLYDDFGTLIGEVVGYAYCSMSDVYNKKIGRKIANRRAVETLRTLNGKSVSK